MRLAREAGIITPFSAPREGGTEVSDTIDIINNAINNYNNNNTQRHNQKNNHGHKNHRQQQQQQQQRCRGRSSSIAPSPSSSSSSPPSTSQPPSPEFTSVHGSVETAASRSTNHSSVSPRSPTTAGLGSLFPHPICSSSSPRHLDNSSLAAAFEVGLGSNQGGPQQQQQQHRHLYHDCDDVIVGQKGGMEGERADVTSIASPREEKIMGATTERVGDESGMKKASEEKETLIRTSCGSRSKNSCQTIDMRHGFNKFNCNSTVIPEATGAAASSMRVMIPSPYNLTLATLTRTSSDDLCMPSLRQRSISSTSSSAEMEDLPRQMAEYVLLTPKSPGVPLHAHHDYGNSSSSGGGGSSSLSSSSPFLALLPPHLQHPHQKCVTAPPGLGYGEEMEWAAMDSKLKRIRSSERLLQLKEEVEEAMRKKATRAQQQQQQIDGKDEEGVEKVEENEIEEEEKDEEGKQQQELQVEVEVEDKEVDAMEHYKCNRLSVIVSTVEQNDDSTSSCNPSSTYSSLGSSSSLSFKRVSRDGISPTAQQLDMMAGGFGMATSSGGCTQSCRRSSFVIHQPQSQSFNLKHQHQHQQGKEQTSMYRWLLPIL